MNHEYYMSEALKLAQISARLGEVPVGAVVVFNHDIVGIGFNRRELHASALEHAELNAINDASRNLGRWRLVGAVVYSTLEPCMMCASALVHARIASLHYGACDPKFGGIESLYTIGNDARLNHQFSSYGGLLADQSSKMLRDFFQRLRASRAK